MTPRWRTPRGGRTETGSLTGRDSSPAPGGPSGHTGAGDRQGGGRVRKEDER